MIRKIFLFMIIATVYVHGAPSLVPVNEIQANHLLCDVCRLIVEDLRTLVDDNATESQVEDKLDGICNRLAAQRQTCVSMVHQYLPSLFNKISGGIVPNAVCADLDVCPKQEPDHSNEIPLSNEVYSNVIIHEADTDDGIEHEIDNVIARFPQPYRERKKTDNVKSKFASNETCAICEFLVQVMDASINTNQTEASLNATLMKFCSALPKELAAFCMSIAPTLLKTIISGVDPEKTCLALRLCNHGQSFTPVETMTCDACQSTMKAVLGKGSEKVCFRIRGVCDNKQVREDTKVKDLLYDDEGHEETKLETIPNADEPQANPLECELCRLLVKELDKVLVTNKSDEVINATVYKLCGELPGTLQNFCLTYAPRIVQLLETGFDASVVCKLLRACAGTSEDIQIYQYEQKESIKDIIKDFLPNEAGNEQETKCDVCKAVVQIIDKYLEPDQKQDSTSDTVLALCGDLPEGFRDICEVYAPQIVVAMETGRAPAMACNAVQLCVRENVYGSIGEDIEDEIKENVEQEGVGDTKCELCKMLINLVDRYIGRNSSDEKINATVYKLCGMLPGTIKDTCNLFAPQLVKALETGFDSEKACDVVKLCTNGTYFEEPMEEVVEKAKPESEVGSVAEVIDGMEEELQEGDTKCELCKMLINLVDRYIGRNSSNEKINATVYKLCGMLPGTIKDTCNLFAPQLVKALESGFDSEKACEAVKLCTNGTYFEEPMEEVVEKAKPESEVGSVAEVIGGMEEELQEGDTKCELCKLVINMVDRYIGKNSSDAKLNATVYKLCGMMPGTIKATCNLFAPQLVKALESGFDSEKACEAVKLCTNGTYIDEPIKEVEKATPESESMAEVVDDMEEKLEVGDTKCELCKLVINMVDQYIGRNASDQKINATVYKLCGMLPAAIKDTCDLLAPQLVKALASGFDPEKACEAVKLCTNGTMIEDYELKVDSKPRQEERNNLKGFEGVRYEVERTILKDVEEFGDDKCDICEFVIELIDKYIGRNTSHAAINSTVYQMCGYLPGNIKATCNLFAPQLVKAVESGFDSKKACETVKLCTNGIVVGLEPGLAEVETLKEPATQEEPINDEEEPDIRPVNQEREEPINEEEEPEIRPVNQEREEPINEEEEPEIRSVNQEREEPINEEEEPEIRPVNQEREEPINEEKEPEIRPVNQEREEPINEEEEPEIRPVNQEREEPINEEEPKADARCELCEFIVGLLDRYIQQNASRATINTTVFHLCDILPDALQDTCRGLAPMLVKTIDTGMDPEAVCTTANFCQKGSLEFPITVPGLTCEACHGLVEVINPRKYNVEEADRVCQSACPHIDHQSIQVQQEEVVAGEPWDCTVCEFLVEALNTLFRDNRTEDNVEGYLTTLCNFMPAPYAKTCRDSVDEIVREFSNGVDPRLICDSETGDKCNYVTGQFPTGAPGLTCEACHGILEFTNPTGYNAEEADDVCQAVCPHRERRSAVKQTVLAQQEQVEKNVGDSWYCEVCEYMAQSMNMMLKANKTKDEMESYLNILCDFLPQPYNWPCKNMIPAVSHQFSKGIPVVKVCDFVTGEDCNNVSLAMATVFDMLGKPTEWECNVCKKAMSALFSLLDQDYDHIAVYVNTICNRLPAPAQQQCKNFVKSDGEQIFTKIIEKLLSPTQVCELANVCPRDTSRHPNRSTR